MMIHRKVFELFLLAIIILSLSIIETITTQSLEVESSGNKIRCLERERQALLNFKKELIDEYGVLSSWGDDANRTDCCKWRGVRCHNTTNHVLRLDLRGDLFNYRPLRGNISLSLIELRDLNYLDLSINDFSSSPFPDLFGSLSKLRYLKLSSANFNGPIPCNLGNLTELQYLDLRGSTKYGVLNNLDWVSSNLYSLEYIDLTYNNLSKVMNWFQALSSLPSIKELVLIYCDLPQIVNPSFSFITSSVNASASLSILDLGGNDRVFSSNDRLMFDFFLNFSHSLTSLCLASTGLESSNHIVESFQKIVSLSHLDLSLNKLEYIPKSFGNISSLNHLIIPANSLIGQLSDVMMNLSGLIDYKLQILDLGFNGISGPLPNMSRFPFLMMLSLKGNQLNGTISEGFLQLPNLVSLDLSRNLITGQVPDFSFSKRFLKELNLGNNMFIGKLTKSIGGLSKLESLLLGSNQLDDTIGEEHVFNLSRLRKLDLSSNSMLNVKWDGSHFVPPFQLWSIRLANCKLGPQFPDWLRTQKQLFYLDISNAQISDDISNLWDVASPNLAYLNASNNHFYGFISNFSFSMYNSRRYKHSLQYVNYIGFTLDLSRNNILGSIHSLCNFSELILIDLSYNQFAGRIPDCFGNFGDLQHLYLANNHFHGKIPSSFGNLASLSSLYLHNNNLSGEIPKTMRNCTKLELLDLSANRLSGEIPSWIQNEHLGRLVVLVLRSNEFHGGMPSTLCNLRFIHVLDISSNKISGKIPKCLGNLTAMSGDDLGLLISYSFPVLSMDSNLKIYYKFENVNMIWKRQAVYMESRVLANLIDLSNNNLFGEIPWEVTQLVGLLGLNLSSNKLTGPIPQNISHLKFLNFLDLSRNDLSGAIPWSLSELSFLGILDLSYNNLSGRIPQNGHLLTFDESTYIGNFHLCGRPLNKSCPEDGNANKKPENCDEYEENEDQFVSEGFYICMGIGFVVGFYGILGTILLNKYPFFEMANSIEEFTYVKVKLRMRQFKILKSQNKL